MYPVHDPGLTGVEQQQRVEVAVARVEDVHHVEVVALGDGVDLGQHLDQAGAGHDRVVQVVVGRHPGDRPERRHARYG
jgi:hypothetical protein